MFFFCSSERRFLLELVHGLRSARWYSPVQALSCMPRMWSRVDLPAPDGPMIDTNSPSFTSRSIRRNSQILFGPCGTAFSTLRSSISIGSP